MMVAIAKRPRYPFLDCVASLTLVFDFSIM
jgi:hypothetical protein